MTEDGNRPGDPGDDELMARFVGGDAGAMEELVSRHGARLFGYLVRTAGRHRAEDLYQEVFLKVIRGAKSYRPGTNFTAWLFTIARNAATDEARKESLRRTESLDAPANPGPGAAPRLDMQPSNGPDPEQKLTAVETSDAVERALVSMNPEQREVFLLRERSGMKFKEIAKLTGAPLNTVKTRTL